MSCDLVLTISALACCIAKDKSSDELALLAAIFSQLGDTLATIGAQQDFCAPNEKNEGANEDDPAASDCCDSVSQNSCSLAAHDS